MHKGQIGWLTAACRDGQLLALALSERKRQVVKRHGWTWHNESLYQRMVSIHDAMLYAHHLETHTR